MLIERDELLASLQAEVDIARAGQGSLLLLSGEAGIGKTSVAGVLATQNQRWMRTAYGHCDGMTTPRALGPLFDLAREMGHQLGDAGGDSGPRPLFDTLLSQLRAMPTLAIIEDLHWADDATLDLLRFLSRRISSTSSVVVVTYRSDEVGAGLRVLLGDLTTRVAVRRFSVEPLSADGVAVLAHGRDIDPAALHLVTGGNAFFVTEALATPGLPPTVRDAVLARTSRLSEAARRALDAVSVLGTDATTDAVIVLADVDEGAVDECIARGLLLGEATALRFRHELARLAIEATLPAARAVQLHRRALQHLGRAPLAADPSRLAHHARLAGDAKAWLRHATAAARLADRLGAHREAAAQYGSALAAAPNGPPEVRAPLHERRAATAHLAGDLHLALDEWTAAMHCRRSMGDQLGGGDCMRARARLLWQTGERSTAWRAGLDAVAVLEELPPSAELARAYTTMAGLAALYGAAGDTEAWAEKAITLGKQTGDRESVASSLISLGSVRLFGSDEAAAREQVEEGVRLARAAGMVDQVARGLINLTAVAVDSYDAINGETAAITAIAYAAEHDLESSRLHAESLLLACRFFLGRWTDAEGLATQLAAHPNLHATARSDALIIRAWIHLRRGQADAPSLLGSSLAYSLKVDDPQSLWPVRAARAEAAWLRGDEVDGRGEIESLLPTIRGLDNARAIGDLSCWLRRCGGSPVPDARVGEPFSLMLSGNWGAAAECWDRLGCPYERALTLVDSADPAMLREAVRTCHELGARPLAALASRRLRALGAHDIPRGPRPSTQAHEAGLTNREVEVVGLLAEGLLNPDIAARLHLSPRTVEHHVSAILDKLGVRTRGEAAREAHRLGLLAAPS